MTIFEDLKQALESDISWDLKLSIDPSYFDVILTTRDDATYKTENGYRKSYDGLYEPTILVVRYAMIFEKAYLPIDEMVDGKVLSTEVMKLAMKVINVLCDHKEEIDNLCGCLSGMDREYLLGQEIDPTI